MANSGPNTNGSQVSVMGQRGAGRAGGRARQGRSGSRAGGRVGRQGAGGRVGRQGVGGKVGRQGVGGRGRGAGMGRWQGIAWQGRAGVMSQLLASSHSHCLCPLFLASSSYVRPRHHGWMGSTSCLVRWVVWLLKH